MIGPLTYIGWLIVFAIIALWVAMFRLGRRGLWMLGVAFSFPFVLLLIWIELTTVGLPIFKDPYGPLVVMIVMGPIAIGWLIFFLAFISRQFQNKNRQFGDS
ncbi:MAG: hypothetical protein ABJM58_02480 [Alteripontixanthobacter sp.]